MNPNLSYRPDTDGLPAVGVLAVVLHPLFAPPVPGGYLITGIISHEMAQGRFSFARSFVNTLMRPAIGPVNA